MKRLILLLCIGWMFISENVEAQKWSFTEETAVLSAPKGQMEVGIFAPLRYALSDSILLSTHPVFFITAPNATITWAHAKTGNWYWATKHGFLYPTLLLRQLARKGTGGFISPEFEIPQMISVYNGVVLSKELAKRHLLSLAAGLDFGFVSGALDTRTSIDLPYIYPRLTPFYSGYQLLTELNVNGWLADRWNYHLAIKGFWSQSNALEQVGYVGWNSKGNTQVRLGYFFSYAEYPFGVQAHLILPTLDVVWRFE